jgi:hypothetical protein
MGFRRQSVTHGEFYQNSPIAQRFRFIGDLIHKRL